jgi:hypothetical protein
VSKNELPAVTEPNSDLDPRSRARRAGSARTLLMVAGPFTAAGVALAAVGDAAIGRWLVVAGCLGLILGLHRYGRLGADPPVDVSGPAGDVAE